MATEDADSRQLPRRGDGAVEPGACPVPPRAVVSAPSDPAEDDGDEDEDEEQPRQQLSLLRVLLALALVAGIAIGSAAWIRGAVATAGGKVSPSWFAPYVDATLTPTYQFQDPAYEPARQVVLGFIVSQPGSACTPSWGGAYSLDQAAQALNLDRRIAELRAEGGGVIVSFGGQANTELAVDCTDTKKLTAAYASVIERYHLTTIDLDIEGAASSNWGSIERRAVAIKALQSQVHAEHGHLAVWLTLPVAPNGMQADAISVIDAMLHEGVDVAGVNAMTMDFGVSEADMIGPVEQALTDTHRQLSAIFPRYGIQLSSKDVWNKIGATVMIGQNDSAGEQFTVADASQLESFAASNSMARLSMWSLNRDARCGTSYAEIGVHANTCSGVAEDSLQFAHIFGKLQGTAAAAAGTVTPQAVKTVTADNPATSPYPIWQPADPYETGYKVVRFGSVYQAKWYNEGQDPAIQTQYPWQTPWLLIGPVLPGDHAPTTTTLAPGMYPAWSPKSAYTPGTKVLFDGEPYQAKWYNQATSPAAEPTDPSGSPWKPLFSIPGEPSNP